MANDRVRLNWSVHPGTATVGFGAAAERRSFGDMQLSADSRTRRFGPRLFKYRTTFTMRCRLLAGMTALSVVMNFTTAAISEGLSVYIKCTGSMTNITDNPVLDKDRETVYKIDIENHKIINLSDNSSELVIFTSSAIVIRSGSVDDPSYKHISISRTTGHYEGSLQRTDADGKHHLFDTNGECIKTAAPE